jgi:phage shock protein E
MGLILIPSLLLFGCLSTPPLDGTSDEALPTYGLISPQQAVTVLNTMLGQPDFVLLDIRTAPEIAESHVSGAVALDFYSPTFQDNLAELEREITYLIYCRTGNRTGQTMVLMENLGFEQVFDLDGGIRAWTNRGYPVCAGSLDAEHSCSDELP